MTNRRRSEAMPMRDEGYSGMFHTTYLALLLAAMLHYMFCCCFLFLTIAARSLISKSSGPIFTNL